MQLVIVPTGLSTASHERASKGAQGAHTIVPSAPEYYIALQAHDIFSHGSPKAVAIASSWRRIGGEHVACEDCEEIFEEVESE